LTTATASPCAPAAPCACSTTSTPPRLGHDVEQPCRQLTDHPVPDEPALALGADHPVRPQQPQRVRHRAVAHAHCERQVGDAQVTGVVQGEQDAQPVDVAERVEYRRGVLQLGAVGEHGCGVAHLVGVDDADVTTRWGTW